jgi:acetolactate synthase-1/2/3 large subunit
LKASDYVARRLAAWGLDTCFAVTGGGAMHLNDSFGADPDVQVHYMHHEEACSMAAEAYARLRGRPAVLNVTSGPGGLNALNGVFGAFTDSLPMLIVAGQVRRDTIAPLANLPALRQLGEQEARLVEMVRPVTVWAESATDPERLPELLDQAVLAATSGRPGPAWLEIPVDVQGAELPGADPSAPLPRAPAPPATSPAGYDEVLARLAQARRPLIITGGGVRAAGVSDLLAPLAEALGVPVATAWTNDTFPNSHPLYAGRPGTIGTRAANFIAQSADVILVLGSRLSIRQLSYNWAGFAPHASVIWVDIDPAELAKPTLAPQLPIIADLRSFVPGLLAAARTRPPAEHERWGAWCREIRARFEPREADYPVRAPAINPYHLVFALGRLIDASHVVACGDATASIVPFQIMPLPDGARLFSNSGCASMGYDLPAALGAAVAAPDRPVVCLAGDGSVMMNLQELQTLASWQPNLLLIILDNGGYLSIRQTQSNFFGREFGASPASGVSFPDFARVGASFGLPAEHLDGAGDWQGQLAGLLAAHGPRVCVAPLDRMQEIEPRLKSKMVDGKITSPALDDMYPHLDAATLAAVRDSALAL